MCRRDGDCAPLVFLGTVDPRGERVFSAAFARELAVGAISVDEGFLDVGFSSGIVSGRPEMVEPPTILGLTLFLPTEDTPEVPEAILFLAPSDEGAFLEVVDPDAFESEFWGGGEKEGNGERAREARWSLLGLKEVSELPEATRDRP